MTTAPDIESARAQLPVVQTTRKCGSCSACCTTLAIREAAEVHDDDGSVRTEVLFEKEPGVRCEHVRGGNKCCGIYEERPGPCKIFTCGWVMGLGSNKDRPDKNNAVFTMEETDIGPALVIYEVRERAARNGRVLALAQALVEKHKTEGQDVAVIAAGHTWRHVLVCPTPRQSTLAVHVAKGTTQDGRKLTAQVSAGGEGPDW